MRFGNAECKGFFAGFLSESAILIRGKKVSEFSGFRLRLCCVTIEWSQDVGGSGAGTHSMLQTFYFWSGTCMLPRVNGGWYAIPENQNYMPPLPPSERV